MAPNISGRTVLVTGGSLGIGAAIALALGGAGADVAVNYRERAAEAESVAAAIIAMGRRSIAVAADVSDGVSRRVRRAAPGALGCTTMRPRPGWKV